MLILSSSLHSLSPLFSLPYCYCHQCHWPWASLILRWIVPFTLNPFSLPLVFVSPTHPFQLKLPKCNSGHDASQAKPWLQPNSLPSWSRPLTPDLVIVYMPHFLVRLVDANCLFSACCFSHVCPFSSPKLPEEFIVN